MTFVREVLKGVVIGQEKGCDAVGGPMPLHS